MTEVALVIVFSVVMIGLVWFIICNERTAKQMTALIPSAGDPDFWEKIEALRAVDYNDHLRALFLFKDPYAFYDPIVFKQSTVDQERYHDYISRMNRETDNAAD